MFSQFRQAVESLAQPLPNQSQDSGSSADARSQSPDPLRQPTAQPSTQLAENALMNLRRSLAAQRTGTATGQNNTAKPGSRSSSPAPSSNPKGAGDSGLRKTTLEERLRASFVVEESSGGSTPSPSTSASPAPHAAPVPQRPLSPASTPLPESPNVTSTVTLPSDASIDVPRPQLADTEGPPAGSQDSTGSSDGTHIDPNVKNDRDPLGVEEPAGDATDATVAEPPSRPEAQQDTKPDEVTDELPSETDHSEREGTTTVPDTTTPSRSTDADVESLRERLKLMEQRFADVSTSFKRLQAERLAADSAISELTPLEGTKDIAAFRDYLANVNMKVEISQDELQRLTGKLTRQEERFEELRETHRLETTSQSDQMEKLRQQLHEAEALIVASQTSTSQLEADSAKRNSELANLHAEVAKANETAKEEEEKRVKAISLLKTVRQKLVKAEKDRDDALKELNEIKGKGVEEKEREKEERAKLQGEIDAVNAEREKAVAGLRAQFDKEIAAAKDRAEKELQTARKQFEAEMSASKTSYSAEISAKKSQISTLESSVNNLTSDNRSFFEQLQLRQAELESSQYHAESLQAQNTELQFQFKELQERITLLNDEASELRGEQDIRSQVPGTSSEEISQIVSSVEAKYEAKLAELRRMLTNAEKERTEAEANWSHKLMEKNKETEELNRMLRSSAQSRERDEDLTGPLKAEIQKLQTDARSQNIRMSELQSHIDAMAEAESVLHRRLSEAAGRAEDSEQRLEEIKAREAQLRAQNKTLRDELRKVQSSVALLEKQRNPGVGYWTSRPETADSRTSISSVSDAPASSPSSPAPAKGDEEINFEYLRNVILQFLEHKEMRPNLVRVLSIILRFTPQETRRLMAKV